MFKLQIGCIIITLFICIIYFSTKRVKTFSHFVFSASLIVSLMYFAFDIATVYTVTHLHTVSPVVNHVCHIIFLGLLTTELSIFLLYSIQLIQPNCTFLTKWNLAVYISIPIYWLLIIFLPLDYIVTPEGNYSWGAAASIAFVSLFISLTLALLSLILHWKEIDKKKRQLIVLAYSIQLVCTIYQSIIHTALISSLGIALVNLALFLTVESPDVQLIEQLKYEKERADAANVAKSQFLSNMSHEIRTPLNTIIGTTEILLRDQVTDSNEDYLLNIKHSGETLLNIINDILDFSKIESGKFEIIDDEYEPLTVFDELRFAFLTRIKDKPITFHYNVDPDMPAVLYGDSLRIRQVIINLVNNAIKFTEEGDITFTAKILSPQCSNPKLFISVQDTGQGIFGTAR